MILDNAGDGQTKRADGTVEWTGTYRASGTIWRGEEQSEINPSREYIERIQPVRPANQFTDAEPQPMTGVSRRGRFRHQREPLTKKEQLAAE